MTHTADDDLAIAPDGSPVLLYRLLPAGDEPGIIASALPPGATVLELGSGAGRVTRELVRRGLKVTAVDESAAMLAWVDGVESVCARIEDLDLGRRFDGVVLGSHLVNTPDQTLRDRWLATCRRHVGNHGVVLVEHQPVGWDTTAAAGEAVVGDVVIALCEVVRRPPFVTATAEYRVGGRTFRQRFTARVLRDEELRAVLTVAGLPRMRRLTAKWVAASPTSQGG